MHTQNPEPQADIFCTLNLWQQVAQVTPDHLIDHFFNHAINDNLGVIANAWLARADEARSAGQQQGGVRDIMNVRLVGITATLRSDVRVFLQVQVRGIGTCATFSAAQMCLTF